MVYQAVAPEDRLELRALVDDYSLAVDTGDREWFARLFTPDGVIRGFQNDDSEPGMYHAGYQELLTALDPIVASFSATMHVMANHSCTVDGDVGTGVVYGLAHHLSGDNEELTDTLRLIRYDDRYVRGGTAGGSRGGTCDSSGTTRCPRGAGGDEGGPVGPRRGSGGVCSAPRLGCVAVDRLPDLVGIARGDGVDQRPVQRDRL